jgi:signal transduction histidine kinase/CheY-like chemotaxis protein
LVAVTQNKPKILIVDDKPENLYALEKLLKKLDVEVVQAFSGAEALNLALEHDFCVAIVDIQMPEMDGYELVELLRSNEDTATLPAIFVSAIFSDEYHHRKGYEAGAVDFMSKPFVPEILLSKVKVFIDLYQQRDAEKRRRQLAESLEQIGRALASSLDMTEVPNHILEQLSTVVPYEHGAVLLCEGETLRVMAQRGFSPTQLSVELRISAQPGSVFQQLTETRRPLRIDDVTITPAWQQMDWLPTNRSWLGVPLISKDQVIGLISLTRREAAMFKQEEVSLVSAFAGQAAVALENASLYDRLMRFNEELERLVQQRTEELGGAYQALAKIDKTKSDFIAVAAHELRSPLTLIRGYAALLQPMVKDIPESGQFVEGILTGERRLLQIVESMLDISKIDSQTLELHKEPTNLIQVVGSVRAEFEKALKERRLTLIVTDLDCLPAIQADPDLMFKLFSHLIGNAIKYTPDGGSIMASGRTLPGDGPGQNKEDWVQVFISDTGIGIDPAHHELIFGKFYQTGQVNLHSSGTTKFKGGGPGLGLSIARGIVQAHGGRIWVESPGHDEKTCPGSCFHLLLPVNDQAAS